MFKSLLCFIGLILILTGPVKAEYASSDFINDWSSPLYKDDAKSILIYGSAMTATLIAFRKDVVEPFQESMFEQNLLGDSSHYGDLAGQLIPNLLYMGYMSYDGKYNNASESSRRAKLMFKVSAFSGLTTFFLKRVINQRRPNKGDRNSFPSGHTTTAFAFASVVAKEHPNWKYASYALASFVGFSRINDNAHYLHDVLMGATIGTSYGFALHEMSKKDENKNATNYYYLPLNSGHHFGLSYSFD